MLDVARETYKENVGDILDLARSLSEEHNMPFTPVFIESAGGFWLTIRKDDVEGELPRGCINVTSKGVKYRFTTMELVKRALPLLQTGTQTPLRKSATQG